MNFSGTSIGRICFLNNNVNLAPDMIQNIIKYGMRTYIPFENVSIKQKASAGSIRLAKMQPVLKGKHLTFGILTKTSKLICYANNVEICTAIAAKKLYTSGGCVPKMLLFQKAEGESRLSTTK